MTQTLLSVRVDSRESTRAFSGCARHVKNERGSRGRTNYPSRASGVLTFGRGVGPAGQTAQNSARRFQWRVAARPVENFGILRGRPVRLRHTTYTTPRRSSRMSGAVRTATILYTHRCDVCGQIELRRVVFLAPYSAVIVLPCTCLSEIEECDQGHRCLLHSSSGVIWCTLSNHEQRSCTENFWIAFRDDLWAAASAAFNRQKTTTDHSRCRRH
jgi:hypothetical protein